MQKKSLAEQNGLSYEERVEGALDGILFLWNEIDKIITSEEEYRQRKLTIGKYKITQSGLSPKAQSIMEETLLQDTDMIETETTKLFRESWESGISTTQSLYGEDASTEALRVFHEKYIRTQGPNAA